MVQSANLITKWVIQFILLIQGIYIVDTRFGLHDKDLKNLRLVVKYSNKWVEHSELLLEVVPKWVLAPPKDGWKQFPPDINWKGAELDTAYMQKLNLRIP